ncbi:ABC transporter ATP-binding protein [Nocardiopsis coralliicola]
MATGLQRNLTTGPGAAAPASAAAPADGASGPRQDGAVVAVRGLTRAFDGRPVLHRLDLDVAPGEFVVLLGASGCGKSTLLRVLADLDRGFQGGVRVARNRAVGFQAPRLVPWKRVWRNVVLGLPGRPDRARAVRALEEVGLGHRTAVWPKVLSGGEAQRAALARALIRDPDLLLLDEPFSALDALTRIKAQELVAELWQRHGCAVVLVTHDVEEAALLADRVLVMEGGAIAHDVHVGLARPRDRSAAGFVALRTRLLALLGVGGDRSGDGAPEDTDTAH